jgi:hypothetical protein
MVSVLASSAVDRGLEPWSGQTKDYKIGICCFSTKQILNQTWGDETGRRIKWDGYSLFSSHFISKKWRQDMIRILVWAKHINDLLRISKDDISELVIVT